MNVIRPTIDINLNEYGLEGVISMGEPSWTRREETKDEIGNRCTKFEYLGGQVQSVVTNVSMMEELNVLMYVDKAPFKAQIDPFRNWMTRADEKCFGSANKVWNAMKQAVQDITDGKISPFVQSDTQATPTSE